MLLHKPAYWRQVLRQNFSSIDALMDYLELTPAQRLMVSNTSKFRLNVPLRLAQKMSKANTHDPIFRQFVPLIEENLAATGFECDSVGDQQFRVEAKLLKKYNGRALLICTSACVMHCRYCFRQNFDYEKQSNFDSELKSIQEDTSLKEIILSGGDPLYLDNKVLDQLLEKLDQIVHLKRVRFHTRFPIGIPERIDEAFLKILTNRRLQVWFVVHVNHHLELDDEVLLSLKKIQKLGIPVLNQSVLLKGVNDNSKTFQMLCEKLIDHGIQPYYLHQLDREKGVAHFEVNEDQGHKLIAELSENISGYGVPKYVREVPGESSKRALFLID